MTLARRESGARGHGAARRSPEARGRVESLSTGRLASGRSFATLPGPDRSAERTATAFARESASTAAARDFFNGARMTASKQLFLISAVTLALAAIVKAAQVALTPDLLAALSGAGRSVIANVVVRAILLTLVGVWVLSLCVREDDRG